MKHLGAYAAAAAVVGAAAVVATRKAPTAAATISAAPAAEERKMAAVPPSQVPPPPPAPPPPAPPAPPPAARLQPTAPALDKARDAFMKNIEDMRIEVHKQADDWLARAVRDSLHKQAAMRIIDQEEYDVKHPLTPEAQMQTRRTQLGENYRAVFAKVSLAEERYRRAHDARAAVEAQMVAFRNKRLSLTAHIEKQQKRYEDLGDRVTKLDEDYFAVLQQRDAADTAVKTSKREDEDDEMDSLREAKRKTTRARANRMKEIQSFDKQLAEIRQERDACKLQMQQVADVIRSAGQQYTQIDGEYNNLTDSLLPEVRDRENNELESLDAAREEAKGLLGLLPPSMALLVAAPAAATAGANPPPAMGGPAPAPAGIGKLPKVDAKLFSRPGAELGAVLAARGTAN